MESIENSAFWRCSKLPTIIFPNGLKNIDNYAFEGCSSLQSAILPESVERIGIRAFNECEKISNAKLPNNLNRIEERTFYNCESLNSINIPNSLSLIDAQAFMNCKSLNNVSIPSSVSTIGEKAFWNCESLSNLYVHYEEPAYYWTNAFETIYNTCTLHVPNGKKSEYEQFEPWKNFFNIVEGGSSAISNILIDGESGGSIYNINGTKVDGCSLGKGIFIKNGKKVIIK